MNSNRSPLSSLLILLLSSCTTQVSKAGQPNIPLPADPLDRPFLFIEIKPAFSPDAISGLLVAVWNDGRILRAKSDADIGKSYLRGTLTPQQLHEVRDALGKSKVLSSHQAGGLIVDAMSEWLFVRWGDAVQYWSHSPGYKNTNNAPESDVRITKLHQQLMTLPLHNPTANPPGDPWIPPQWRE